MTRYLLLLAFLASCAHVTPPVGAFGHCTTDALIATAPAIEADVTTALASSNYVALLDDLAVKFGPAEVGCAVDLIIAEFRGKAERSNDAQVAVVLTHAQAWRGARP